MSDFESTLKLFALSNQLIEHELDRIELEWAIDLGRGHTARLEADETYYPQIDRAIRHEGAVMAMHYEVFYSLEKTIRSLVSDTLQAAKGTEWWDGDCVAQAIKQSVDGRIQREVDSGVTIRSTEPLDFTTFGELGEIIKTNWEVFGSVFSSPKAVERVMANLNTLRGPIAHCSKLAEDEVVRLRLSVRDWFRLME